MPRRDTASQSVRGGDNVLLLDSTLAVLSATTDDLPGVLSASLQSLVPHSALAILTGDAGAPYRAVGPEHLVNHLTVGELTGLRESAEPGRGAVGSLAVGSETHQVWLARADSDALLVLIDPGQPARDRAAVTLWRVAAAVLNRAAREASPRFLRQSRTVAAIRAQVIDELTDLHLTALESLVAVLRSNRLDDRAARQTATRLAAESVVRLRTSTDHLRSFNEEPVTSAFERLRDDLRPLARYRDLDVQFIEPPVDGRALPSEIAHGARAVVRGAVLALADQNGVRRVRVQWDCDGTNLLVDLRDDGPGELSFEDTMLQHLRHRISAMHGRVSLETTTGWGSELSMVIPLDPPRQPGPGHPLLALSSREAEVLDLMVRGSRNQDIADRLGISVNTVKYHTSNIFRTLGATSRAAAIAIAIEHGMNGHFD
ncbi:MAG: LuxR C-terminal-related transcriptional regulator [Actinocrinis sp.]